MPEPASVEEVDRQLADYRKILKTVSVGGRVAVWEQIDRMLELRQGLAKKARRRARLVNIQ